MDFSEIKTELNSLNSENSLGECKKIEVIHVICDRKDNKVKFECPFCRSSYRKDGYPYLKAKKIVHIHGIVSEAVNGSYGIRTPHCGWNGNRYARLITQDPEYKYVFKLMER